MSYTVVQRRNKRKHRYALLECERGALHKFPINVPDLPNLENLSVDEQHFIVNIFDPRELDNLDY
jgi:hypothetical protein